MPPSHTSRRSFLGSSILTGLGLAALPRGLGALGQPSAEFDIRAQPPRTFRRTSDMNREGLEHIHTLIILRSTTHRQATVESLEVGLLHGAEVRQSTTYARAALVPQDLLAGSPTPAAPPYGIFAMQLRTTHAQALAIDAMRVTFVVRDPSGREHRIGHDIRIEQFQQATSLVFPFRGPGLITQGGIANDGHRNASGLYAIDAIGLDERYAAMKGRGDAPEAVAGWGREIIAPGAGTVVLARGDRPDQRVVGQEDPALYAPDYARGGDPGNHVVIDHGNGEFSLVAHLQQGTLVVAAGERVAQGQRLGAMGNSGASNTPHVHHQLQTGADLQRSGGLPHHYDNGPGRHHDRGWFFDAK